MYRRYKGLPGGQYSLCTVAAILDNCLLSWYSVVSMFPLSAASLSNAVNTTESNGNS